MGEALASKLQQQGHQCSLVYRAESYHSKPSGIFELNPARSQDFKQLYQAILQTTQLPLHRVIHLWSLDIPCTPDLSIITLEAVQHWSCASVLYLLQEIVGLDMASAPQIWLITRGSQAIAQAEEPTIAASPLWGFGKVLSLEHPLLWGGLVDLDPQAPDNEADLLLKLVSAYPEEDHLALRGEKPYVARLVNQPLPEHPVMSFSQENAYLITGGTGALGLHVARWMVAKGARNLILMARNTPSEIAIETIQALEKSGAHISVLLGDIANQSDVARIFQQIQDSAPILKGIIHAAGVVDDGILQQLTWEQWTHVMAPKLSGAWHLHEATQHSALRLFVVCFSSITSLLGAPGQGNYAAANAFMDALAHYRRAQGLSGLSINWGPWHQGGMATRTQGHQRRVEAAGMHSLSPEQGVEILEQLLLTQAAQVGVIPIQWSILAKQWSNERSSLLRDILSQEHLEQRESVQKTRSAEIIGQLETVPEQERLALLKVHLQSQVVQLLGLGASQLPAMDLGFTEMGMDSLMTVELHNRLQTQLGTPLPVTAALEYPTIDKLSQYICEEIMEWRSEARHYPQPQTPDQDLNTDNGVTNLQALSDEEVEAKLMEKLNNKGY